jgi:hypothetical protein
MRYLLSIIALALSPGMLPAGSPFEPSVAACPTLDKMTVQLAGEVQTGTLLFSQGDCLAVKVFSKSDYTHVAAVVVEDGEPYVYESTNGAGVHKQPLAKYVSVNAPNQLHVMQPSFVFNQKLQKPFVAHLRQELGRPYAVKHHLTGKRCEGLHCSEYVTDALIVPDIIRAKNPPKVSPASLLEGIAQANLYHCSLVLTLEPPEPAREKGDGWCERMWLGTKYCTLDCYAAFKRKVLCR